MNTIFKTLTKGILATLLIAGLASCDMFKKAQDDNANNKPKQEREDELLDPIEGTVVYNPETGMYDTVRVLRQRMDTLILRDVADAPVITSDGVFVDDGGGLDGTGQFGTEFYSTYNVSVMLPFVTNRFNLSSANLPENSDWAVHFYAGMQMAFDVLEQEGVSLNVTTVDTKGQPGEVNNLLRTNSSLLNAHVILGPYRKENVKLVANFAKKEKKTMISPYSASTGVAVNNPNYIQVNPTLESHSAAIMQHARKKYRADQIVLIAKDGTPEVNRLNYFQQENFKIEGRTDLPKIKELLIKDDNIDLRETDLKPFINTATTTVFIIPSFASEAYIGALMRKIYLEARYSPIVVYGMPQWQDFSSIDYDVFENLNLHISSSSFLDPYSVNVQDFKRRFFDRFGTAPEEQAFWGYDDMLYFGRMLKKHGTKFQYFLDADPGADYLHTRFNIQKELTPESMRPESKREVIQKFENRYVNILKFEQYFFQIAN
ncbi:MAG: ABC transporter substrate-binding protein [Saprospiraceae bacterium]